MSMTLDRDPASLAADIPMPAPLNLWRDERPLPDWVQGVAKEFDVDKLVDVIIGRCLSIAFPNQAHDDEFRGYLTASTRANARCLRSVIAGEIALEDVYLEQVLSFAKVQAQLRIPQKSMQRSYRVSFFTMWEAWSAHLRQIIVDRDVDRDEAALAQQLLTQTILGYQDFVASQVAETYTRDYEALNRSRAHMRRSLVKDILRDESGALVRLGRGDPVLRPDLQAYRGAAAHGRRGGGHAVGGRPAGGRQLPARAGVPADAQFDGGVAGPDRGVEAHRARRARRGARPKPECPRRWVARMPVSTVSARRWPRRGTPSGFAPRGTGREHRR